MGARRNEEVEKDMRERMERGGYYVLMLEQQNAKNAQNAQNVVPHGTSNRG